MAKAPKEYMIKVNRYRMAGNDSERTVTGTLEYLRQYFNYTLECGQSYERERGNRRVNMNPKSGKSLVSALNQAEHNRSRHCQMTFYSLVA